MLPKKTILILGVFLFGVSLSGCPKGTAFKTFTYLTWQNEETSTHITVNVLKMESAPNPNPLWVYYDTDPKQANLELYRNRAQLIPSRIPEFPKIGAGYEPVLFRTELGALKPGAPYYFVIADGAQVLGKEKKFRTIADDESPLRFVSGGDMGIDKFGPLAEQAAIRNAQFALIGGDIAYDNGQLSKWDLWLKWFTVLDKTMVTADGFLIPLVAAVGNHECDSSIPGGLKEKAPAYFFLFEQAGEKPYYTRRFGKNLVLFVLDSSHTTPHSGEQAQWLAAEMKKHQNTLYKLALYHVPLYPTRKEIDEARFARYRQAWLPLFDDYRLTVAFENHDHLLKRTKLLRENKIVKPSGNSFALGEGTLYLGDGRWGRHNHEPANPVPWYIEKLRTDKHVWFVDLTSKKAVFQALSESGRVLDSSEIIANE